jgi:ribose transport system substrate-binding protein
MKKRTVLLLVIAIGVGIALTACSTSNQTTEPDSEETETAIVSAEKTLDWSLLPAQWNDDASEQPAWTGKEPEPQTREGKVKIGWCPPEMIPYYELALSGVKQAVDEIGSDRVELVVQAPASHTAGGADQVNILESWIDQDFAAIIVSAVDDGMLTPVFEKAASKNIAVIEFNMPLELTQNEYFVSNVGTSAYQAGYAMGEWVKATYGDTPTKVAVIEGIAGLHTDLRMNSFLDALATEPNFELVASQPADWSRDKAADVTENILVANPDVDLIYALYDDMALGAAAVIKSMNREKEIAVLGYDMTPEGLAAIKSGEMTASVYNGCKAMGYNSMWAAYLYACEGVTVPKAIFDKPKVIDATNADSFTDFD